MEPMEPAVAKQWIRRIIAEGTVTFSTHALEEMAKDEMTTAWRERT
jgi:hypothetical protein